MWRCASIATSNTDLAGSCAHGVQASARRRNLLVAEATARDRPGQPRRGARADAPDFAEGTASAFARGRPVGCSATSRSVQRRRSRRRRWSLDAFQPSGAMGTTTQRASSEPCPKDTRRSLSSGPGRGKRPGVDWPPGPSSRNHVPVNAPLPVRICSSPARALATLPVAVPHGTWSSGLLHLGGMPWARIGELVGHDDLVTTARTYTHVVAEGELDYGRLL